ncbi:MAG: PLP-dependent aminotransferase family protein [Bryobacteraceae bacterium]|nr:PLP-dependent aminotransferase family protein [Bryobacteraceae bacterium]
MARLPKLDATLEEPLYRQLFQFFRDEILSRRMPPGSRMPPTRELAGQIGLNRITISSAYDLLESDGLIRTHVGRGSFVAVPGQLFEEASEAAANAGLDWEERLSAWPAAEQPASPAGEISISFATARPAEQLFPVEAFRETCREVLNSGEAASILQLGSPHGYPPLRHHLMDQGRLRHLVGEDDDLIVTNGCQQALDLLQRLLVKPGEAVLVEDPIYPGMRNVFARAGVRLLGVPVGSQGIDLDVLARLARSERPSLLVVTPNFQNPTGVTMPEAARRELLRIAAAAALPVVENDIYGELRYVGEAVPTLKELDQAGLVIQVKSFSKLAFPGLRVGWVTGPQPVIRRLAELKQVTDLHTDHLSQAVLLQFDRSGRLEEHRGRILEAGRIRLSAVLSACAQHLPAGAKFTRPEGGMNLWVRLPEPLDAAALLPAAQRLGVAYLPAPVFEVSQRQPGGFRLSFAGLAVERIERGLMLLGKVFQTGLEQARASRREDPAPAIV